MFDEDSMELPKAFDTRYICAMGGHKMTSYVH